MVSTKGQPILLFTILALAFTVLLLTLRPYYHSQPLPTPSPKALNQRTIRLYYFNINRDPEVQNCVANDYVEINNDGAGHNLEFAIDQLIYNYFLVDKGYEDRAAEFHLKSATISQGVATLTFSDPQFYTSGGSCRVGIIKDMIEKTSLQFPGVTSVKLVGAPFQP